MKTISSDSLCAIAADVLAHLRVYLSVIQTESYSTPIDLLSGSTIGQHTRHIIEFYQCLIEQSSRHSATTINYSERHRDYLIETIPGHALKCIDDICNRIQELNTSHFCILDVDEHGSTQMVTTTVGRELIYNIEHTIHHLAIVKIALKLVMPSLQLPEHFGVAPSTIRHRYEACAQ
jgi:hypothetical protein